MACRFCENIREVKLDVYGKLTANGKINLLPSVFSSLFSGIKIFVFAVNSKRHFSIFALGFIYNMKRIEKQR